MPNVSLSSAPSWGAYLTAKAAWVAAAPGSADKAAKQQAMVDLNKKCQEELGLTAVSDRTL